MPDSVTDLLDSAPLRTAGGEAQRAAGGLHRGLFPFPRPSRPQEELCCRRHRHQPHPPHQRSGLPAQGLLCPLVRRNSQAASSHLILRQDHAARSHSPLIHTETTTLLQLQSLICNTLFPNTSGSLLHRSTSVSIQPHCSSQC